MHIDQIQAFQETLRKNQAASPSTAQQQDFHELLTGAIEEVNRLQNASDQSIHDLMTGKSNDINSTVMAVQQADTSFRMMMQVRNKIIEAYKEIQRSGV
jgi:flagellar hook-basal body complex protein FliE